MNKSILSAVLATAFLLSMSTGQALAAQHNHNEEYDNYDNHNHGKNVGIMQMHVHFPKEASYYGDIEFNVNDHRDKFDAQYYIKELGSDMDFPYTYYDYKPEITKACLENLVSGNADCQTIDSSTKEISFVAPD